MLFKLTLTVFFDNIELLSFDLISERSRLLFFVVYRLPHHCEDNEVAN